MLLEVMATVPTTYFNLSVAFWTLEDIFWWWNGSFITISACLSTLYLCKVGHTALFGSTW